MVAGLRKAPVTEEPVTPPLGVRTFPARCGQALRAADVTPVAVADSRDAIPRPKRRGHLFEALLITGDHAPLQGTCTVNSQSGHPFVLTFVGGGPNGITDRISVRIWNCTSGIVSYDRAAGLNGDRALTPLQGGMRMLE